MEAEERQSEEELAGFAGRTLRRSLPSTQTPQQQTDASGSNTRLPLLQEEEDDDGNQLEDSQLSRQLNANPANQYIPQLSKQHSIIIKMGETNNGGRNQLPEGMKLKGEKNYVAWKEAIEDLAIANGLRRYIHAKGRVPEYADEFDEKVDEAKLAVWLAWEAGDSSMKMIIKLNVKKTPGQMLAGCKSAREMWVTLQTQYKGTGAVLNYNAIESYTKIKYKDYPNLEQFIIAFKKAIEKLANLDISPPEAWHPILFIMALSDTWPIWAERQRLSSRKESTRLTLTALIEDITYEARNKDKKAEGGSALYGGRPDSDKKGKGKGKGDKSQKGDKDDKKKGKPCKNCKNPNAYHEPDRCFFTNKKLRREWEEKTGETFVPYQEKKSDKKKSKKDASDNDDSSVSGELPVQHFS
jgi:hypothetical protein